MIWHFRFDSISQFPVTHQDSSIRAVSFKKQPLIPPHVAWPMAVVLLLLMSLATVTVTVIAAKSDGGVDLVEGSPYAPRK